MARLSSFAECSDRVYSVSKAFFGDGSPIWQNIEASLLPGEKVAAIFGSVQINRNLGGVLVLSSDGMRFFDRKAFKKATNPLLAIPYVDMADLRHGLNITLKTASRDKYSIVSPSDAATIYEMILELGVAGAANAGRLYVPLSIVGLPLNTESLIRVAIEDSGLVLSQDGREDLTLEYERLDSIAVGGPGMQVDSRGGGMIGGGFGVAGFVVGAASAALYNRLTTRTDVSIETILKIEGDGFEATLLTPEVLPEDLEIEIASARTKVRAASRAARVANAPAASVSQQLKELADLRDAGVLSEAEFTAAKAKLIG